MHFVILGLGLLLTCSGAASLLFSLDLLGIERGNVLAVSGAVAIAGGLIVVALGLVLLRLEGLAAAILARLGANAALPLRAAEAAVPAASPAAASWAVRGSGSREAAGERVIEPPQALPDFLLRPELAAPPVQRPEPGKPRPDLLVMSILDETGPEGVAAPVAVAPRAPDRVQPVAAKTEPARLAPMPVAPIPDDPLPVAPVPAATRLAELHLPLPPASPAPIAAVVDPPRLFPTRTEAQDTAMPALQPDQGAAFQPDLPGEAQDHWLVPETSLAEVPQLPMPSVQPHSAPPPAAPPPPVPAAPHPVQPAEAYAPAPDVIGRYNAGGAAYVMYSDGSIDAETQTGTFRFASMKELRQFIEHRTVPAGTGS